MIHDRAYHRSKSFSKARRKYQIDRNRFAWQGQPWYDNLHQYADNKIFCSYPICAAKTNNRGRHSWNKNTNWSISDSKKIEDMQAQQEEL